jgi:hypothetical protein
MRANAGCVANRKRSITWRMSLPNSIENFMLTSSRISDIGKSEAEEFLHQCLTDKRRAQLLRRVAFALLKYKGLSALLAKQAE